MRKEEYLAIEEPGDCFCVYWHPGENNHRSDIWLFHRTSFRNLSLGAKCLLFFCSGCWLKPGAEAKWMLMRLKQTIPTQSPSARFHMWGPFLPLCLFCTLVQLSFSRLGLPDAPKTSFWKIPAYKICNGTGSADGQHAAARLCKSVHLLWWTQKSKVRLTFGVADSYAGVAVCFPSMTYDFKSKSLRSRRTTSSLSSPGPPSSGINRHDALIHSNFDFPFTSNITMKLRLFFYMEYLLSLRWLQQLSDVNKMSGQTNTKLK